MSQLNSTKSIIGGNYEVQIDQATGDSIKMHYIAGRDRLLAIHKITTPLTGTNTVETFYTNTDHLGSILSLTDASGKVAFEQNFDAWGRERNTITWDYKSGKTYRYMIGGAIVGGISGEIEGTIGSSGVVFANTKAIVVSSFLNSVGTNMYTEEETSISVSFGFSSYNFDTGEWGI